jgi:hypothetical protein
MTGRMCTWALAPALACLLCSTATAEDDFFVGPRALGMGGANTASTDDQTAQYYNPSAFGFFHERDQDGTRYHHDNNDIGRKTWGMGVDVSVGEEVQGHMAQYLDLLSGVDIQSLANNGIQNLSDLTEVVNLASGLGGLDNPGNGLTGTATAGYGLRIGHFGLGARAFFEASVRVNHLDLTNLGLTSGNINNQIATTGATGDGHIALFTPTEQTQLTNAGLSANSIQVLDYLGRQNGVTAATAQDFTNVLSQISSATNGGGGSLSQNQTTVLIRAFALGEIPVTYGHAFGSHFSVGANLKLMVGRVYDTSVLVFDNNAQDTIRQADKNYQQSLNWGVDVGAMARMRYLQAGITARNINGPRFKGPTVAGVTYADVRVDPQVTAGVAFMPFQTLVVESDCDLLRAHTTLDGFETQRLSGGLEWNALHFLALRAGVYKNIAEESQAVVYTAGVGLNLYAVRIDLAGASSLKKDTFNGKTYPQQANASLGLMVDF